MSYRSFMFSKLIQYVGKTHERIRNVFAPPELSIDHQSLFVLLSGLLGILLLEKGDSSLSGC